jgi:hypothetical protein
LDYEGNYLIPPVYDRILIHTAEHLTARHVRVREESLWGIWDLDAGELVVPVEYESLSIINESLARAFDGENYFYINIPENRVLDIPYDFNVITWRTPDGFMRTFVGDEYEEPMRFGLIDSEWNEIFAPQYAEISFFSNNLLRIGDAPNGFLRSQRRLLEISTWEEVLPRHDFIDEPSSGFARINQGGNWIQLNEHEDEIINGSWGFINEAGEIIIPPILQFERVMPAHEGIAAVQRDGKWGFIQIEN